VAGCASSKLLRLENELLGNQNDRLREELAECRRQAPSADYATTVTPEVVVRYLERAGFPPPEAPADGVLVVAIDGVNTDFRLAVQLFEREKVLFLAVNDYLEIEEADSSQAMVLLLTQLAAMNYEMLLGKFQLNPRTGAISLSVELNLDDGLGFRTFESVARHLVTTADEKYPDLLRAARGEGL
jgi:hypothetical protein